MSSVDALGLLASVVFLVRLLPQPVRLARRPQVVAGVSALAALQAVVAAGAWVAYGLGTENANLPAFVTVCPTLAHGGVNNWGAAFLPARCQGVPIGNASTPVERAKVRYIENPTLPPGVQRTQLDLMAELNRDHLARTGPDAALDGRIDSFELAFRMQTEAPELMDLSGETKATLVLYGVGDPVTDSFGRQ